MSALSLKLINHNSILFSTKIFATSGKNTLIIKSSALHLDFKPLTPSTKKDFIL